MDYERVAKPTELLSKLKAVYTFFMKLERGISVGVSRSSKGIVGKAPVTEEPDIVTKTEVLSGEGTNTLS